MRIIRKIIAVTVAVISLFGVTACGSSPEEEFNKKEEIKVIDVSDSTDMADTVTLANRLANGVQAYFTDEDRTEYVMENGGISLKHNLTDSKFVSEVTTADKSKTYLSNTLDVYVVKGLDSYYTKKSPTDGRVNTVKLGYYYYEVNVRDLSFDTGIPLVLDKTYNIYSDKIHQEFGIVATSSTRGVDKVGFELKVRVSDVAGIEIFDGNRTYSSASDDYDKSSVQYVAFDIKNVGVIGIIVPEGGGEITLEGESSKYYVLHQELNISGKSLSKFERYSFGNRLYNDETHSFEGIAAANKIEKTPLTSENIQVDESVDEARFSGYDAIKGFYAFNIAGTGFEKAYFYQPQKKFYEHITVKDSKDDRNVYFRVRTDLYPLEGACLVDGNGLQLPVPVEVCKNFGHEKEEPIYDPNDPIYGESYIPVAVKKDTEYKFSVVHVMKTWGNLNFDIKQLSSISFYVSYYHLSTGVTESTCIAPYYTSGASWQIDGWILPDFRGCSEDFWADEETKKGDPQYGSVGQVFSPLNEGGTVTSVYRYSEIKSEGLTNADIVIHYVSSDNKYEYTIRHVEMPQNDENRVYYTIDMKFLEDTDVNYRDFSLIGFNSRNVTYAKSAYLDTDSVEQEIVNPSYGDDGTLYPLNRSNGYFSYYDINEAYSSDTGEDIMSVTKDIGNFGVIIKDYDIIVNGSETDIGLGFFNTFKGGKNYGTLTLDSDVTFKKGDSIKLDLVLLPYGAKKQTNCQNVENVYNDTVINAISVDVETGEKVSDTWIPTVKAADNVAQFTVSGGVSEGTPDVNYAVKIEGCTVLTVPKIQEYVDGQWVDYEYATELGFDGYSVAAENGTLTYSFVFKQNVSGRTFRFSLEK